MKVLLFALVLLFAVVVFASVEERDQQKRACPNNCSLHGVCSNNKCSCQPGWQGDDCSIEVTPLQSGVWKNSQSVRSKEWIFYTISTTSGQGLIVQVNQSSNTEDVDLYLLRNALPSLTNYEEVDSGLHQNYTLVVSDAKTGVWYLGLYGFVATIFNIRATVTGSECPALNNCNAPHGVCVAPNVCNCTEPYVGADCSQTMTRLTSGTAVSATVGRGEWNYYYFDITSSTNVATIIVNQTVAGTDVDLYVRKGNFPTTDIWDYRDFTNKKDYSLTISEITSGRWIIGMFGFTQTQYTLKVVYADQCPNQCSKHGSCTGVSCTCNTNFGGEACQNMTVALTPRVSVPGYVGGNTWNYFFFQATTISTFTVNVTQGAQGDCDLYARANSPPTATQYDYLDISVNKQFTLIIPDPGTATWYFGMFGYASCDYTILVDLSNTCPGSPPCSGHGTCANGICSCVPGWGGPSCSQSSTTLSNGGVITSSTTLNNWQYFTIETSGTSFLAVDVKETTSVGTLWVFVSKNIQPDIRTHDYADVDTNSALHSLDITLPDANVPSQMWYIGVYGNPYASNQNIPFKITAWYAPW